MTISENRLDELQQLTDAATEATIYGDVGEWKVVEPTKESEVLKVLDSGNCDVVAIGSSSAWMCDGNPGCGPICSEIRDNGRAIGAFIVAAKTALPELISEVRRLRRLSQTMGDGLDATLMCPDCKSKEGELYRECPYCGWSEGL